MVKADFNSEFEFQAESGNRKFENAVKEEKLAKMSRFEREIEKVLSFLFDNSTNKAQATYHVNDM